MREIKFRGKRKDNGEWIIGDLVNKAFDGTSRTIDLGIRKPNRYPVEVLPETVGQFTGLKDKNGKDVFEDDVLKHYSLKNYTQQSHYDINPEIDTYIIRENKDAVTFNEAAFRVQDSPIEYIGLHDIENIKERCNCVDDETSDINGNEIDETILGMQVIGNIHDNPELLKP